MAKYLENIYNKNIQHQLLWDMTKAGFKGIS